MGILFYFCLRFCQGVLPQAVPGVFCSKFAKGFAKGFSRRICRGYFALNLPKVLQRGLAAGSAGGILL